MFIESNTETVKLASQQDQFELLILKVINITKYNLSEVNGFYWLLLVFIDNI